MGEWTLSRLSDAIEIIGGGTPNTQTSEYWGGAIPWLSVVDFNDGYRWVAVRGQELFSKGAVVVWNRPVAETASGHTDGF